MPRVRLATECEEHALKKPPRGCHAMELEMGLEVLSCRGEFIGSGTDKTGESQAFSGGMAKNLLKLKPYSAKVEPEISYLSQIF
jgi:hypothetical protein